MTMMSKPGVPPDDDEIDLLALVGRLWSSRWLIAGTTAMALLGGAAHVLTAAPVFRADALLQLEGKAAGLALPAEMQSLLGEGESRVLTEIDILTSRYVLGQVVDDLNLHIQAGPRAPEAVDRLLGLASGGLSDGLTGGPAPEIAVTEFAVPAAWLGQEIELIAGQAEDFRLVLPDGASLTGRVGAALSGYDGALRVLVAKLEAPADQRFSLRRSDKAAIVSGLRSRLAVSETGRQSSMLRLELQGKSPEEAERILNSVLDAYVMQNVTRSSAEAAKSLDFIDGQLPEAQAALSAAENALNAYRQSQRSVDIAYETSALLTRVTELEQQLSELNLKEEEYKRRFTDNHPIYQALLEDRVTLQQQLAELREKSLDLPETQKQVFNLTRNLEVAQQVYMALLSRQQELRVIQASAIGNVRVLDKAFASDRPIAPKKSRILALAGLLGFLAGCGWVLGSHALRRAVQSGEDVEKLGLPLFATVGFSDAAAAVTGRDARWPIIALTRPNDLAIEALRSLRTALHFGMIDARSKAVVLTSAAPAAGKTFVAVNLAVVAAQAGQRVCLIDGDLRRGYLRRFFGLPKATPGLANILAGDKALTDVIHATEVERLSVVTTGPYPPNPSELLMRRAFTELLAQLDSEYDLILIDSPPTLAVTDPVIMARNAGSSLCVVRHMETAVPEVEAVVAAFNAAGARLSGAILNGVKTSRSGYGTRYYYYNRRYRYQGSDAEQTDRP